MTAIEDFEKQFQQAVIGIFGRPLISAVSFALALPLLGFPTSKAIVTALIVFAASACWVGRRALHIASAVLVLYTIPVYLDLLPTPAQALSAIGNVASARIMPAPHNLESADQ